MSETPRRTLNNGEVNYLIHLCHESRYPARNAVIILLTVDAGLTVTEVSALRRGDVMEDGLLVKRITVPGKAARTVPMSDRLFQMILTMMKGLPGTPETPLILPERYQDGLRPMRPHSIANQLFRFFAKAGLVDAGSRSGRRTFIRNALAHLPLVGGSVEDVQQLAGFRRMESLLPYAQRQPADPERQLALMRLVTGKMGDPPPG